MSYENERIMRGINRGLEHHAQLKQILTAAFDAGHTEILLYQDNANYPSSLTDPERVSAFAERITHAATFHGPVTVDFGFPAGPTKDGDTSQFMEVEGMEIVSLSMAPWLRKLA